MKISSYLDEHEHKSLLRVLTCGSVDDGKSTLIGRLLYDSKLIFDDQLTDLCKASEKNGTTGAGNIDYALLLDGLKAEREQGITIDVAYRFFTTPKRKFIIADCPGHEQYTRNMATGASTADVAIILIDARNGVMTQTRRHAFIVSLLGIRHLIVAVNKMDIFGYDEDIFIKIRRQFKEFAQGLDIPDIRFIPISALEGENVIKSTDRTPWYRGEPLLSILETIDVSDQRNLKIFRFPVQYVVRPNLNFRGFAGSIISGEIHVGDEIVALPSVKPSRIRRIVTADGDLQTAFAPQAVVLELEDEIDISAGEMIVKKDKEVINVADKFEAHVIWMQEHPLQQGSGYLIRQAGRNTQGRVRQLAYEIDVNTLEHSVVEKLPLNHVGRVVIETNTPLFFDDYRSNPATGSFILIDPVTNATAGAGMIIRRRPETREILSGLGEEAEACFITRDERVKRYGHEGCSVLISGENPERTRLRAQQLERTLFRRHLHTFALDSTSRSGDDADAATAELSYSLAETGLICLAVLGNYPECSAESALGKLSELITIHVWIGSAAGCPNSSYFIIPDTDSAVGRLESLADLLADPSLGQYTI